MIPLILFCFLYSIYTYDLIRGYLKKNSHILYANTVEINFFKIFTLILVWFFPTPIILFSGFFLLINLNSLFVEGKFLDHRNKILKQIFAFFTILFLLILMFIYIYLILSFMMVMLSFLFLSITIGLKLIFLLILILFFVNFFIIDLPYIQNCWKLLIRKQFSC